MRGATRAYRKIGQCRIHAGGGAPENSDASSEGSGLFARGSPAANLRTWSAQAVGGAPIIGAERRRSDGPGPEIMDAATLTGDTVVNSSDEDLGKIEAIMLDVTSGRIAYAMLSFGGFLGMGAKYFAIPWSALMLDAGEKRFILGVSKDRLENAPGFDNDHWPSMADHTWATELHAYYNVTPYWDDDFDDARDRRSTPDELTTPRVY